MPIEALVNQEQGEEEGDEGLPAQNDESIVSGLLRSSCAMIWTSSGTVVCHREQRRGEGEASPKQGTRTTRGGHKERGREANQTGRHVWVAGLYVPLSGCRAVPA